MMLRNLRAAATVAAVYGFFLLFAQFSFVELIRASGLDLTQEKVLLGGMAIAGIATGFLAAWKGVSPAMIRFALVTAAFAGVLAPFFNSFAGALAIALLTGSALGLATVSLAALLPTWCGLSWVGLGTGIGYAICNLPIVFEQSPVHQSWFAAGLAITGALVVPRTAPWNNQKVVSSLSWPAVVLVFTALVWMDSAAFFIIQHEHDLKSATWGSGHLWRNALVHLGFAVISGWWLNRGGRRMIPWTAWFFLASASILLNRPSSREFAGWLYPAGVSLYSVALVAWPGFLTKSNSPQAASWKAAWLFAIAGWFGSANGIGMAQSLQRVPYAFILVGSCVVAFSLIRPTRTQRSIAIAVFTIVACGVFQQKRGLQADASSVERGRAVYQSEGCIHCHSRYSRPGSKDELIWGPAPELKTVLAEQPALIGNRRHGPDLSNIGARRSAAWLKAHFIEPRALSPESVMPSYKHLFSDQRGDDLVSYLKQSGISTMTTLVATQAQWNPVPSSSATTAPTLFARHCAICHGADGTGKGTLANQLPMAPPNLRSGPFIRTQGVDQPTIEIARVIKFGVVGSEMPGHETLSDSAILSLSTMLMQWRNDSAVGLAAPEH
jgi:cytochrome c oxidase cbb3-type subunit 2